MSTTAICWRLSSPSGRVTFYVYTTAGGSRKKYKLGSFPDNKPDECQINKVPAEYRRIWFSLHLPVGMRPIDLERQSHRAMAEDVNKWEAEQSITLNHVFKEYMRLHGDKKKSGHQDAMVMKSKFSHLFEHPIKSLGKNAIIKSLHKIGRCQFGLALGYYGIQYLPYLYLGWVRGLF